MKNIPSFDELYVRFPEDLRKKLHNCEQDPKWHPEGSVENHIRLVYDYALNHFKNDTDLPELLLGSLFHDLGKIDTQKFTYLGDNKYKITNYGHEDLCDEYLKKYFHLFSDVSTDLDKVTQICKLHMYSHTYKDGKIKKKSKIENFQNNKYFDTIMKFEECDANGR